MLMIAKSLVLRAFGVFGHGLATGLAGGVEPGYEVPPVLDVYGLAGLLVLLVYEPLMVARWGATVGKQAMGIRVVRYTDGAPVSAASSWLRVLLPTLAGVLTLGTGWFVVMFVLALSMAFRRDERGWHDRLAGTVVVRASAAEVGREPRGHSGLVERGETPVAARAGVPARVGAGLVDVVSGVALVLLGGWSVLSAMEDYGLHYLDLGLRTYLDILSWSAVYWAPPVAMLAMILVVCGPVVARCWGATAGQRIAGIRVVRFADDRPVGPGGALLRWAVSAVPLLVGVAALLWAWWSGTEGIPGAWLAVLSLSMWALMHASVLWDPQRRGWRDKLVGTSVVRLPAGPSPRGLFGRRASGESDMARRWQEFMRR